MGPLGWQETLAILIVALLVFGPKKLPQLGKDLASAMGQFRRATNDLKGTWDRELAAMEREADIGEVTRKIDNELAAASVDETYHGTSSSYDSGYDYGHGVDQSAALSASTLEGTLAGADTSGIEPHGETPSTDGATATQGAVATSAASVAQLEPLPEAAESDEASVTRVADTVPRKKPETTAAEGGTHS